MEARYVEELAKEYQLYFQPLDLIGHEDNVGQKFFLPFMEAIGYNRNTDIEAKPQIRHQIVKSGREPDFGVYQYDTSSKGQALYGIVADVKRYGRELTEDMEEKLAGYCVLTGALYGILTNGQIAIFIRPKVGAVDWDYLDVVPTKKDLIEELEGKEIKYDDDQVIFAKRTVRELDEETVEEIAEKCHDTIRSQEGMAVPARLYEFSKLIVARIIDERRYKAGEQEQLLMTEKNVKEMEERHQNIRNYIQHILGSIQDEIGIFEAEEGVDLNASLLKQIISYLDEYPLWSKNMDVLGHVYEKFLMNTMTGRELGGYFTPRPIVETLVKMIDPSLNKTILDPACGSGGFLINSLMYLKEKHNLDREEDIKDASTNFSGIDLFPVIQKLSQINLWLHGDCHDNIYQANTLLLNEKTPDILTRALENPGEEGYDIILTNPPYGAKEGNKLSKEWLQEASETWQKSGYNLFESAIGRNGEPISLQPQVPFLEICMKLLKKADSPDECGRMGIVLDNGILSNTVEEAPVIRKLIKKYAVVEAIIGLPKGTFQAYGSNVIPIFMIMRRRSKMERDETNPIFRAQAQKVGLEPGQTKYKRASNEDLEQIIELWESWEPRQKNMEIIDKKLPVWSTNEWDYRIDNNFFSSSQFIAKQRLQDMVDEYDIKTLNDISEKIISGKSPHNDGDIPLIEGSNIYPNHIMPPFNKMTTEYVSDEKEDPYVTPYDLLIIQDGSPGRVTSVPAIISEEIGDMMPSNHCYLLHIKEKYKVHSAFISSFLNSRLGQALIRKYIAGSVSPTIRKPEIKNLKVPIPKDEEKSKEIMKKIEQLQRGVLKSTNFLDTSKDIEHKLQDDKYEVPNLPLNWYPKGKIPHKYEY